MTQEREGLPSPVDYMQDQTRWPDGDLAEDAPPEAHLVKAMVAKINLRIAIKERQLGKKMTRADFAKDAQFSRQTVYDLLDGNKWPAMTTIVKLERYFNVRLWGNEHRKTP